MISENNVASVVNEILRRCKELRRSPDEIFRGIVRKGIDSVVDGPRTGRFHIDDLSPTEKTYIGTKVEMICKAELDLPKGKRADAEIAGVDVDIKWSKQMNWMIGPENVNKLCLGLGLTKTGSKFSVGVFYVNPSYLRRGVNRDAKLGLSAKSKKQCVTWLVKDADFPPDFLSSLSHGIRSEILKCRSSQERMRVFAKLVPNKFVPRHVFETLAPGRSDPLRRTRKDKYRTAPLGDMCWISTRLGKAQLKALGIQNPPKDHWIAVPLARIQELDAD